MEQKRNSVKITKYISKAAIIIVALLFSTTFTAIGKNYYFSTSTGNDSRSSVQAQSQSTPWKTINKLNSVFSTLLPGDSILFKRGEVFYGSIIVGKSGTSFLPIVIGAYGTGAKPVISGFTTLTSWTSIGGGIYQSAVVAPVSQLNMVTLNNVQRAIGRYPNTGYLTFESHVVNSSITDNQLTSTPNWTNAEVVIKKAPYSLAKYKINSHVSSTINYTGSGTIPKDNFGYFIQNSPKTLDLLGEWYMDSKNNKFQMYFGSVSPSSYSIKVSTLDTLVECIRKGFITFTDLKFEGGNLAGLYLTDSPGTAILNCDIDNIGGRGIWAFTDNNIKIENCSINHCNMNAIYISCVNASIRNNIIKNIGLLPGMSDETGYTAIHLAGTPTGTIIEYNEIDSVGRNSIYLIGNSVTVKNNLINYFGLTLDDCAGIYTLSTSYTGRKITGNIILNGIGNREGTNSLTNFQSKGIFLDEPCSNVEITNNTVANCSLSGLHFNNSHDVIVNNNLFFNNKYQINIFHSSSFANDPTRNVSLNNNILFSKTAAQYTMSMYSVNKDIAQFGKADNNYYCRPMDDNNVIITQEGSTSTPRTLAGWQSFSGQDLHSKKSPQSITNDADLLFQYNASTISKKVTLSAVYIGVDGTVYTGSFMLSPYTSIVLIKSSNQSLNLGPTIQDQTFKINENSPNGTSVGNVIATTGVSGQTLTYSILSGNTNGAFSINSSTGALAVANSAILNFEVTPSFPLIVKVQVVGNSSLSAQATINVALINLNEKPVITSKTFSLSANSSNGTFVGNIVASDPDAGQTLTYSIVSGNINNSFALNTSTGVLTVANSAGLNYFITPTYSLVVKVTDNGVGNLNSQAVYTINLTSTIQCSATGYIAYQVWENIGNSVSVSSLTSNVNFPDNPTTSTLITSMEGTKNLGDSYGARIVGYICAPSTGSYIFWIASDDNGELWLSTDDQPVNKNKIAYVSGYTSSRQWDKYASQKSVSINLVQGQKYYIEALMKEATGGDNLAVGWLKPGQTGTIPSEIIPGTVLSPYTTVQNIPITSISLSSSTSIQIGSAVTLSATVLPVNATNNTLSWTSSKPAVANVNANGVVTGISPGSATITATSTDGSNKTATCVVTVEQPLCSATGNITYQVWNNIGSGVSVNSLTSNVNFPDNPTSSTLITSMEGTKNLGDEFGARIVGYICAPSTGTYTFWIASDDYGELWLSTDDQPTNKSKIAYVNGYTASRQWDKYASQKSATINLVQGQKYYIEALMKEATGGDNLAIGWLKPGQTGSVPSEVIPGAVLSPYSTVQIIAVSSISLPSTSTVQAGTTVALNASVLPVNATNNALVWSTNNMNIATVNSSGIVTGISPGVASITATSTDGSNKSATCIVTVEQPACSATGNITYQIWKNIGSSVSVSSLTSNINFPDNPTSSVLLTSMEGTTNFDDQYGARIVGYICAPSTGSYTFWIASDDNGELWLSTDDQPANKIKIAYVNGYTASRQWDKYTSQKSVAIDLVQGQKYYIEALMKESTGGDNLAVGWLKPGQTGNVPSEIVPGEVLSPFNNNQKKVELLNVDVPKVSIKVNVYPNPLNNDNLNINIENLNNEATLQIFSLTGVVCLSQTIQSSGTVLIDRSVFKSGLYIVKVFNTDFVVSSKLIVN